MNRRYDVKVDHGDVWVGRVIGENDDGITMFFPKDLEGEFSLKGGEVFRTTIFIRSNGQGSMVQWVPWRDGPVMPS